MTETRRLKNVVIFIQTILSFVLSRKIINSTLTNKKKKIQIINLRNNANVSWTLLLVSTIFQIF